MCVCVLVGGWGGGGGAFSVTLGASVRWAVGGGRVWLLWGLRVVNGERGGGGVSG